MNAKIKYKIEEKNYERIRNQVVAILTTEFNSQATNYYNEAAEDVNVYGERFIPIQSTELTVVNVCIAQGVFDNHTYGSMDGTYRLWIKITTNSKWKGGDLPDTLAVYKNHRVSGIVNSILSDPTYKTLAFDPGFIERVRVMAFESEQTDKYDDARSTADTTLVLEVKSYENVEIPEGVALTSNYTTTYFTNTGKGYQFVFLDDGPPPPLNPRYVYVRNQYLEVIGLVEGGNYYDIDQLRRIVDSFPNNQLNIIEKITP